MDAGIDEEVGEVAVMQAVHFREEFIDAEERRWEVARLPEAAEQGDRLRLGDYRRRGIG